MALAAGAIDPTSFSSVRILSGAATLWIVTAVLRKKSRPAGSWISASLLAAYAFGFSYAYVGLTAGTGALILMGVVQATMIVGGIRAGERFSLVQWLGILAAAAGTVYLVLPGVAAPSLSGSLLMAGAGVAWGIYSLRGRGSGDPVTTTTDNFIRAVPLALLLSLVRLADMRGSIDGVILAVISGSVTSGIGYVLWYAALRRLKATQAAIVQLSVPVIAAAGGVAVLSEPISARLVASSIAVLGGIAVAILWRARPKT
jgi:drug/metabolite transporter (DMT)-like permease